MKSQKLITLVVLTLLLASTIAFAKKLEVDPNHSTIAFEATHLKISKIPGRFTNISGTIELDEKDVTQSKVDITTQIASLTTEVEKRDEHLRTADFFDAKKFPIATFKSTSIKRLGTNYQLTGDLTIRDVTKKVSFIVKNLGKVEDPSMKVIKTVFSATGKINRKDFGINYGPDAIVGDEVDLWINLETVHAEK